MKKLNVIAILTLVIVCSLVISSKIAQAYTYRTNEHCTGYVATGNEMANGQWPKIGDVAVHPTKTYGNIPIIKFGTELYIDSIRAEGKTPQIAWVSPIGVIVSVLTVGDIGDPAFNRGLSTYFVDLYFGYDTTAADNWGKGSISYHYN